MPAVLVTHAYCYAELAVSSLARRDNRKYCLRIPTKGFSAIAELLVSQVMNFDFVIGF